MKLTLLNLQRLLFFPLAILVVWGTKSYIRNKDSYQNTLIGVVNETKYVGNNSYLIKFNGTQHYNMLSKIKTKEKIVKGDSIYKPLFSDEISVYRKEKDSKKYKLLVKTYR